MYSNISLVMSSDSDRKSICKSIYTEAGFSGILTVLKMFPERLHDEMLEELSMNMFEWENKLHPEEKEDIGRNLSSHAVSIALQDIKDLNSLKEALSTFSADAERIEERREYLIKSIAEFPSICPETDIEIISVLDEEMETIRKRVIDVGEHIDNLSTIVNQKTIRREDNLF